MPILRVPGLVLSRRFFATLGVLLAMKTLEDDWDVVIIAHYYVGYQDLLLPEECNVPRGRRPSGILHSEGSNISGIQHRSVHLLYSELQQ